MDKSAADTKAKLEKVCIPPPLVLGSGFVWFQTDIAQIDEWNG